MIVADAWGDGIGDVKCWDVPCPMSDVFVKRPNYPMGHLVTWSRDKYI